MGKVLHLEISGKQSRPAHLVHYLEFDLFELNKTLIVVSNRLKHIDKGTMDPRGID